jgi:hypothetical protein
MVRQTMGTSAAVVLAAVVNAAVASPVSAAPALDVPRLSSAGDLSWAVRCGAATANSARALLAVKAAKTIQSLDRLAGAPLQPVESVTFLEPAATQYARIQAQAELHACSTHQNSAP